MLDIHAVLCELSTMAGPSGFEHSVADRAAQLMSPYVDEVSTDALCNVFGIKRSKKEGAKKLLLSAHLDEIGLMVTKIEDGFLRFRTIGGIDPRVLPASEIKVLTDPPIYGVIGALPPHLQTKDENKSPLPLEKLSIDVGLSQEEAEKLIPIGTPAVFIEKALALNAPYFSGKSLDDRACFVILLRMLEMLKDTELDVDLIVQASSQEEVGTRGATVGAFRHNPDYAIAVDVTHGQTPDAPKERTFKLGAGVPISMGPNTNRKLAKTLIKLAKANEIPWQPEVMEGRTGTDAWPMQVTRKGVATAVVSLPLKYMHTPVEVINLEDLENAAKLLSEFAKCLERGEV
ncbi:MAG: M42 family metallopeptidase [Eubacteriales bacterium]|jgi:putative aminopeptidase FrvX